jgi:sugar O-acyltransferase (sialic acid O-acetyltransferase NeuD family)
MKKIFIPVQDANSTTAIIRELLCKDGDVVTKGQVIAHVETSKAIYDVNSSGTGRIIYNTKLHDEHSFSNPIACIAEEGEDFETVRTNFYSGKSEEKTTDVKATKKAKLLAETMGIHLSDITKDGILSEEDVMQFAKDQGIATPKAPIPFLKPNQFPPGITRVLVIGAGNGLAQVADIMSHVAHQRIVGCVDDSKDLHSNEPFGVPLIGTIADIERLYNEKKFDAAIIAISSNVTVRRTLFEKIKNLGIPFVNVIDPSARINKFSTLGEGNIICSFVHVGTYTSLGDNNFVSAHCSIDHHNIWGSHITLGPGCHFSGRVKVCDSVKFATGIFVQNGIEIGAESTIASGAIVTSSIPEKSLVKTQVSHVIVPK